METPKCLGRQCYFVKQHEHITDNETHSKTLQSSNYRRENLGFDWVVFNIVQAQNMSHQDAVTLKMGYVLVCLYGPVYWRLSISYKCTYISSVHLCINLKYNIIC